MQKSLGKETLAPVWRFLQWSINCLYKNEHPCRDVDGKAWDPQLAGTPLFPGEDYRFRLTEIRGDWKWLQETWNIRSHWRSDRVCHRCRATKCTTCPLYNFDENPAWAATALNFEMFMDEEIKMADPHLNSLLWCHGFHFLMLRPCSMHAIHLGVGLDLNGSTLRTLLDHGVYGPPPLRQQLATAWARFREWRYVHGIACSQPQFRPYMLVSSPDDMCLLRTKVSCLQHP